MVWGRRDFRLKNRRLNRTKEQRQANAVEPNVSLSIQISGAMPLLEVSQFELPSHLLEGEVRRMTVRFTNRGQVALRNLRVKVSHPAFFEFGSVAMASEQEAQAATAFPHFEASLEGHELHGDMARLGMSEAQESGRVPVDSSIVHLPIDVLEPNSTQYLHVWVRGHAIGSFSFKTLYYYEPVDNTKEIKYRVLRSLSSVLVLPSISAAVFARTSVQGLECYLLGITIENVQNTAAFQLAQITAISRIWKLESTVNDELPTWYGAGTHYASERARANL
jgi:trafficking protein particle complex subunit 8